MDARKVMLDDDQVTLLMKIINDTNTIFSQSAYETQKTYVLFDCFIEILKDI